MLTVNAGFKMHMLRSSTAGTSGQSDRVVPGFLPYVSVRLVTVNLTLLG